jgi:hypothetical protein
MTTDLKAAHHVLFNCYDYPKTEVIRNDPRGSFGNGAYYCIRLGNTLTTLLLLCIGLLLVEGDEHKHQVRFQVLFLDFVRELLSNTTNSARFWSVMLLAYSEC